MYVCEKAGTLSICKLFINADYSAWIRPEFNETEIWILGYHFICTSSSEGSSPLWQQRWFSKLQAELNQRFWTIFAVINLITFATRETVLYHFRNCPGHSISMRDSLSFCGWHAVGVKAPLLTWSLCPVWWHSAEFCGLSVPGPAGSTGQSVQIWHVWLCSSDLNCAQWHWLEAVQCSQTQVGWGTGEWGWEHPSSVINHTSADRFHGWSWVAAQSPGCNICSPFHLGKLMREFSDISLGMDMHINTYLEGSERKKMAAIPLFSHQIQPHL